MTLAFNYPKNVGHNLAQRRGQLSVVTMLWAGNRCIVFRFPVGTKDFLLSKVSRLASSLTSRGGCIPGMKRSGREGNHSHPSLAGVKQYSYIYIPRPHICLRMVHRDSFTCLQSYTMFVPQVRPVLVFVTSVHLCKRVESITKEGGIRRLDYVVQLVTQIMFSENSCHAIQYSILGF